MHKKLKILVSLHYFNEKMKTGEEFKEFYPHSKKTVNQEHLPRIEFQFQTYSRKCVLVRVVFFGVMICNIAKWNINAGGNIGRCVLCAGTCPVDMKKYAGTVF